MENQIEKTIRLKAPMSRVWRALTDHREFSEWFKMNLNAPFVAGSETIGHVNCGAAENLEVRIKVVKMEPETLFSYTWHPYAIDPDRDYSAEEPTHVTFRLADHGGETELTVTETGFPNLPADRRLEAFRMNTEGWTVQVDNIKRYVEARIDA